MLYAFSSSGRVFRGCPKLPGFKSHFIQGVKIKLVLVGLGACGLGVDSGVGSLSVKKKYILLEFGRIHPKFCKSGFSRVRFYKRFRLKPAKARF